ncbi:transcriptional regulator, RpiR family [Cohaesibacter sp. ES.047]|uniref:MurR/RpiR family transcriptional regulator n=1 Tax=Cohaesibacter sp. ES.047 TaxID=1798205 RepID=UPI000BB7F675|nr:MurR/RpiR family transcriptional regulator [Cohaesibacter sp. ES.047]SNY91685.1 transcriptional regulator, RpiR family [Cohaesibacter sp. ES.047]
MTPANTLTELQDQIRAEYGGLSKRLQQVAQFVIDNHNSVAFDTIAVIAEKADVPPSTMIRFANTFGFGGFNEMKQLFRDKLIKETTSYTERAKLASAYPQEETASLRSMKILKEFSQANAQALKQLALRTPPEDLHQSVELLAHADTIYVAGMGRSFSIASYLTYALHHLDRKVVLIDGIGGMYREQCNRMSDKDVLVSISFAPYAEETQIAVEAASNAGTAQIVVTDSQISPIATLSDLCFVVNETQIDAFRSQCVTNCLVQSIIVALAYKISESE